MNSTLPRLAVVLMSLSFAFIGERTTSAQSTTQQVIVQNGLNDPQIVLTDVKVWLSRNLNGSNAVSRSVADVAPQGQEQKDVSGDGRAYVWAQLEWRVNGRRAKTPAYIVAGRHHFLSQIIVDVRDPDGSDNVVTIDDRRRGAVESDREETTSDNCKVYYGINPVVGPDSFSMEVDHEHPSSISHACKPTVCIFASSECLKSLRPTLRRCRELPGKPRIYKACVDENCRVQLLASEETEESTNESDDSM